MTTSFPFLAIARRWNVEYGRVIRAADFIEQGGGGLSHFLDLPYRGPQICKDIHEAIHEEAKRRGEYHPHPYWVGPSRCSS